MYLLNSPLYQQHGLLHHSISLAGGSQKAGIALAVALDLTGFRALEGVTGCQWLLDLRPSENRTSPYRRETTDIFTNIVEATQIVNLPYVESYTHTHKTSTDNVIVMDIDNILAGWPTYEVKFTPQKPGPVKLVIRLKDAVKLIPVEESTDSAPSAVSASSSASTLPPSNIPAASASATVESASGKKFRPGTLKNGRSLCAHRWLKQVAANGSSADFRIYWSGLTKDKQLAYEADALKLVSNDIWNSNTVDIIGRFSSGALWRDGGDTSAVVTSTSMLFTVSSFLFFGDNDKARHPGVEAADRDGRSPPVVCRKEPNKDKGDDKDCNSNLAADCLGPPLGTVTASGGGRGNGLNNDWSELRKWRSQRGEENRKGIPMPKKGKIRVGRDQHKQAQPTMEHFQELIPSVCQMSCPPADGFSRKRSSFIPQFLSVRCE
ncbi:hypothetical protein EV702DRAFT_1042423 [Suillus placidus]|uniref:Uncharacterized protein n=1 Tax=Suillus placidus TaxID=48579 RepID=A0A9P7D6J3_9AGAM|nr:hypothetical protein EV702DRAFT_1042423 [Suillus placidus]